MDKTSTPLLAYDVPEIAAGAKVSEAKIWMEIAEGELETILVGDRRLATPDQVERWLKRKEESAARKRQAAEMGRAV
jgi:hypothetical protein